MNFPPLTDLLPHRPPMLLLRRVLAHHPTETACEAIFDPVSVRLFGGEGFTVPAALALELIAQAMAVHDGLRRHQELRPGATRGLLLGSRRFELLARTLPVGAPLRVVASGEAGPTTGAGLVRFSGRVENAAGLTLAQGDVTVLEHRPETSR